MYITGKLVEQSHHQIGSQGEVTIELNLQELLVQIPASEIGKLLELIKLPSPKLLPEGFYANPVDILYGAVNLREQILAIMNKIDSILAYLRQTK